MAVEAKATAWPPLAFPLAVTSGRFYTLFFFYSKVQKFGVKTTLFDLNYSKSGNIVKYFTILK